MIGAATLDVSDVSVSSTGRDRRQRDRFNVGVKFVLAVTRVPLRTIVHREKSPFSAKEWEVLERRLLSGFNGFTCREVL